MKTYMHRRVLLSGGMKAVFLAGAAILAGGAGRKAYGLFGLFGKKDPGLSPGSDGTLRIDLNKEEYALLRNSGGAVKIVVKGMKKPIILIRTGEQSAAALSSRCTHLTRSRAAGSRRARSLKRRFSPSGRKQHRT